MGWVLDLDGVVWLGDQPIDGAAAAIRALRDAGERVVFVTNMSYGRVADVVGKLAGMGIAAEGDVVTSASAAGALVQPGERVLVCGGPGLVEAVESRGALAVPAAEPPPGAVVDAVLVGYDPAFDYARMTAAATAVRRGARLIASNDDATYPTPQGPIPGGGAILASIERATGVTATVAGKPHPPICELVRQHVGGEGTVVGDRPETDGRFARALGFRFALVLSGVTTEEQLPVQASPDVIARDLACLVLGDADRGTAGLPGTDPLPRGGARS
ncbi:HAD-IIA family hydrolase [Rhabdothermincola sp.]|jgi:4-nitrophenyl phosphatase|uniref:HAD-IIA family hydrolase n=1 Tax=Rhabdothermincola sp. TaxID=2820405 RepID=UPI002FE36CEC